MNPDPKEQEQTTSTNGPASDRRRVTSSQPASDRRVTSSQRKSLTRQRHRRHGDRKRNIVKILNKEKERVEEESRKNAVSLVKVTCKNIVYFVLLYSAVLCCRAAITTYIEGMTDEIQQKYSFSKSQISLIHGTEVIGLISSLPFVALLGRNCHKPLLLTFGVLVCSIGTIIFPVPYFAEKTIAKQSVNCNPGLPNQIAVGQKSSALTLSSYSQACQFGQWNASYINPCSACLTNDDWLNNRQTFLSILCIAGFLIGLGTGLFITTGFVYVEENGGRKNGPIFYGVFLSMTGFGHFLGSCIVWWFLEYTEDLDDELDVRLDWTTKAWWLGFVFFCVLLFVSSWIFLFFPKWISEPDWSSAERRRRLRLITKRLKHEKEQRIHRRENRRRKRKERLKSRSSSKGQNRKPTNEYVCMGDLVIQDPIETNSDLDITKSTQMDSTTAMYDLKRSTSGSKGTTVELMEVDDASSSSDSDSGFVSTEPEVSVISPQRTSAGYGSGLGIIEEEDSNCSQFPSSGLSPTATNLDRSPLDDGGSPVWPLHNQTEENRQSRVVTFASVAQDSSTNQPNAFAASERKLRSDKRTRKHIAKTVAKPFTAVKRTIMTPVFTLSLIGTAISAYLSAGYRSNVVHFTEVHYGVSHIYAWFYSAGLCYSLAETLGPLVGGIIIHKLRMSLFKQTQMIVCLLSINFVLFLLIFPIRQFDSAQQWTNATSGGSVFGSCSPKCDCLDVQLQPVCSSDGVSFNSACQAGCTQLMLQNTTIMYYNCSCVLGDLASSSFCSNGSSMYGPFWIVLFLAISAHSMGQVNVILIFLRSVQEVDRHLALSAAIWIIVVSAFVPGPPIFDALEGTSCSASRSNCYGDDTCWSYNLDKYRYVIHGTNLAFQFVATGFFLVSFYFLRNDPVEPVGYGKEDLRNRTAKDQDEVEERVADGERANEGGRQSMMEVVQSRIALNLLANKPELMEFQSSGVRNTINKESEDEGNRKSSKDSVFIRDEADDPIATEIREGKTREVRTLSDQSTDSVFTTNVSAKEASLVPGDKINDTVDLREDTIAPFTASDGKPFNRIEENSSEIDDIASTLTEITKL